MEDTQIIALYLSRQEAAIGETAKKYGGYINRIAYNILRCGRIRRKSRRIRIWLRGMPFHRKFPEC